MEKVKSVKNTIIEELQERSNDKTASKISQHPSRPLDLPNNKKSIPDISSKEMAR
jgi:hypothetical protein